MKRKFILLPITLTALAPTISMVGCGNPVDPTKTYVVTLYAGEGTFGESNQIILSNIQPGTLLKDVQGYKTPLGESFNGWLNNGKEFKDNQPIDSNMLLTAKYKEPEPEHDYSKDCLTFTALEDNTTFAMTNLDTTQEHELLPDLHYSTNDGKTWNGYTVVANDTGEAITLNKNEKIMFKGYNPIGFSLIDILGGDQCVTRFNFSQGSVDISGNVMSLLDNGSCSQLGIPYAGCFRQLFCVGEEKHPALYDIKNLILPSTTLTYLCYNSMFSDQLNLCSIPKLPSTELQPSCYQSMFSHFTSGQPFNYLLISDSGDDDKMFMDLTRYKSDSDLPPASVGFMFHSTCEIHAGHKYYWSLKE